MREMSKSRLNLNLANGLQATGTAVAAAELLQQRGLAVLIRRGLRHGTAPVEECPQVLVAGAGDRKVVVAATLEEQAWLAVRCRRW